MVTFKTNQMNEEKLTIRLSARLKAELERQAKEAEQTMSEYIRSIIKERSKR